MDPIVALGAAAAVVQLVSVATQITREAYGLISGARESTQKQISLACLNDTDSQLCKDLLESLDARHPLDRGEILLYQVVETYKDRVGALRSLLQTLVVRKSADGSKPIVQVLKVVIKIKIVKKTGDRKSCQSGGGITRPAQQYVIVPAPVSDLPLSP